MGAHEHFVRWTLWSGGRAVVSHESALAFHELGDVTPASLPVIITLLDDAFGYADCLATR